MFSGLPNPFEQFKSTFEDFQKGIKSMIEKTPKSLIELSKHGWYIDMEMHPGQTIELGEKLEIGETDFVDKHLSEYFGGKIKAIENKLCKNFPKREIILKEGFYCFQKEKYNAAIALLITQADGFCYDKTTDKLFFRNNKKLKSKGIYAPEAEEEIKRMSGGIIDLLLGPIKKSSAIDEYINNVKTYPVRLNRHEILHGIDTNYGTKLNCIKIISFLNYLNDMLEKN